MIGTASLGAFGRELAATFAVSAQTALELEPLHDRQRLVAVGLATFVLVFVVELVRRRKLREEYSWVWIGTALCLLLLAWKQEVLISISQWIGAASTVSTLFFGAFVFLLALVLQFSVRLSRLTHRHRTLGQRLALLEQELTRLRDGRAAAPTETFEKVGQRSSRDEVA